MTTNHPAHGPVSLDRLHQIREHLLHDTQYSNGGNRAYILADMLKVIDEALTASNTQPVAWTDAEELRDLERDGCGAMLSLNRKDCEHADPRRQILLFTHPAPLRNAEQEELRRNYLALRGEIEDVRSQLYEAENQANEYISELQEHRKAAAEPVLYVMGMGCAFDAETASTCKGAVDSWVGEWNQERLPGQEEYKTVPLYTTPQSAPERDQIRREHAAWSQATFGDVGPVGSLKHLSKEALEAAAEPGDLSEWADMQFLLWDAQRRAGISDEQITLAMKEKLAVNKKREWPEPKDGEPRMHIKEQLVPVVPPEKWVNPDINYAEENGFAEGWNACRAAMLQGEKS